MNKKKRFNLVLLVLFCFKGFTQNKSDSLYMNFKIKFDQEQVELQKKYISNNLDTLSFKTFKCYLSAIEIYFSDNSVFRKKNSYHLLDIENQSKSHIPIMRTTFKTISKVVFNIGIDSIASTSGGMSGDLDPINGMYWAWQSGYINMKIEGKSSSCKTRNNEFQFHIGGYLKPNYAMRKIEIPVQNTAVQNNQINIAVDLNQLFSEIDLKRINSVMIPGNKAMEIATRSTKMFYLE